MERSEIAVKDDKRIGALPGHYGISTLKLARVLDLQGLNLDSQNPGRSLGLSQFILISPWTSMVKDRHAKELGKGLL
jgi:hypothetical protein